MSHLFILVYFNKFNLISITISEGVYCACLTLKRNKLLFSLINEHFV